MANLDLARDIVAAVRPRNFEPFDDRAGDLLAEGLARLDLEALATEVAADDRAQALAVMRETLLDEGFWRPGRTVDSEAVARVLRLSGHAIARDKTISVAARGAISRDCVYCGYPEPDVGAG